MVRKKMRERERAGGGAQALRHHYSCGNFAVPTSTVRIWQARSRTYPGRYNLLLINNLKTIFTKRNLH